MELVIIITIFFYLLSTAGYLTYLFLQKNYLQRTAFYLLMAGFLFHSVVICYGFIKSGHIPIHNLRETLFIAGWAVAGVFLIFQYKFNLKILGIYAAPLATLVMVIASQLPRDPGQASRIKAFDRRMLLRRASQTTRMPSPPRTHRSSMTLVPSA